MSGTTYADPGQVLADHMITDGINGVYFAGNNGHLSGGADTLALLEDISQYVAGLVLEPGTGYTGEGKVYVSGCFHMFTDSYIEQEDNHALWENIVAWAIYCPGDLDGDGFRNVTDFTVFGGAYGTHIGDPDYNPDADFDGDGFVNVTDFTIFAEGYLQACP